MAELVGSAANARAGTERYAHIDALRAVAVTLVVLLHAGVPGAPGDAGVTIFFVLSGYVITDLLIRERTRTGGFDIGSFYLRRTLKLFPPLLVLVIVPTLAYSVVRSVDWSQFASQVFFVFNWVEIETNGNLRVLPQSHVVWSLAIEEQFYIVFALVWIALARARRWMLLTSLLAACAIVWSTISRLVIADAGGSWLRVFHGTDARCDAIAVGVLLAMAISRFRCGGVRWLRGAGHPALVGAAIAAFVASFAVSSVWFEMTLRPTVHVLATAIVVAFGFVASDTRARRAFRAVVNNRILLQVGLASYSIYLAHLLIMSVVHRILPEVPRALAIGADVAAALVGGLMCYRLVELPVLRHRRAWEARRAVRAVGFDVHAMPTTS